MPELKVRVFNFTELTDEYMKSEKLSSKWFSQLYEQLFLENGVRDAIQFQEPGNIDDYHSPVKEFLYCLQKYNKYQPKELIILIS